MLRRQLLRHYAYTYALLMFARRYAMPACMIAAARGAMLLRWIRERRRHAFTLLPHLHAARHADAMLQICCLFYGYTC